MWPSREVAEVTSNVANIGLIVSLVIGLIATALIAWMGGIKERYLNLDVAAANAVAATARQNAAEANERAAKADERAAGLESEAAKARLEQERLKAQLAWRSLGLDVAKHLSDRLSKHPGSVTVQFGANDPESQYFAIQLANIFQSAKWTVGMLSMTYANVVITGLFIPDGSSPDIDSMRADFTESAIPFRSDAVPATGMSYGNAIPGSAILIVGSKPLPSP